MLSCNDEEAIRVDLTARNAIDATRFRKSWLACDFVPLMQRRAHFRATPTSALLENAETQARSHCLAELATALQVDVGDLASNDDRLGNFFPLVADCDAFDRT